MIRRGFIKKIALIMASVAGTLAGLSFLQLLLPKSVNRNKQVRIGKVADFPVDNYTFINEYKLFIYRDHESMKAVSAVCTHLGCVILKTTEGFECPCHGSCYNDEGKVLSGPAPRALSWFVLNKTADGTIVVDLNKQSSADEKFYLV